MPLNKELYVAWNSEIIQQHNFEQGNANEALEIRATGGSIFMQKANAP